MKKKTNRIILTRPPLTNIYGEHKIRILEKFKYSGDDIHPKWEADMARYNKQID